MLYSCCIIFLIKNTPKHPQKRDLRFLTNFTMTKDKKKRIKDKKLTVKQLQREVLLLFKANPKKQFNPKQVVRKLKIDNNKDSVQYALEALVAQGHLVSLPDYKFKIKRTDLVPPDGQSSKLFTGYIDMTRTGSAYVTVEGHEDDVHVAAKYMNTALHGDHVQIKVWVPRGRRRPEGEVVKVIERATEHFLGTLWIYPRYAVVSPDSTQAPVDIVLNLEDLKGASEGEKVVVKVVDWADAKLGNPRGIITSVLGAPGSHEIEMKAILINNGFNLEFPEEVIEESETLPGVITEEEIALRLDMREVTTFTIDPDNAKDFDDALSIRYLENGDCEVGVHIADVSHYIKPGTSLDREALRRSTSVYLVDRVLPMLPERLSNELCSLRPLEDKLTFSAIFTFDNHQKITGRWFGRTVIHSNRRFTYDEVQAVLDNGEGDYIAELKQLNKIAVSLRKERFKKGSINFETEEVQFRLDEHGVPIEAYVKERKDSHMLIEDFMLLANREVAIYIAERGRKEEQEIPFVYRIHDEPNPDKVYEFARFAHELGFTMNISSAKEIGRSFNKLVEAAQTNPALKILEPLAIRTMAKAAYSTENIGHYGLGFEFYTHFTSPIRRYSDVLAHRILERNLGEESWRPKKAPLEEQCGHISKMERRAMEAERESVKYKQVEYMEKHLGEVFEGFISGFVDRGIFVSLKDTLCEGLVGFDTFNEPFEISNGRLQAKGTRSRREFKMGDTVMVRIVDTDLHLRRIDMELV